MNRSAPPAELAPDPASTAQHGERLFILWCHDPHMGLGWTVASDRIVHLSMPSHYRYGQMVAATRLKAVPERYGHAVPPHRAVTLCGVPVRDLHRFEGMSFESLGHHLRCPTCDAEADHPHLGRARG